MIFFKSERKQQINYDQPHSIQIGVRAWKESFFKLDNKNVGGKQSTVVTINIMLNLTGCM